MFRTRRVDAKLAFPDRLVKSYDVVPTNAELQLQGLIAANIDSFSPLLQASVLVALMSSPQALVSQLRNMAKRNSEYAGIADAAERLLKGADVPAKIAAVRRVVQLARSQRQDWRIVIFTTRKETQDMIGRVLSAEGVAVGYIRGAEAEKNRLAILGFREAVPKINVIISTDAGAEGVNLQAANVLINYDLPWNPMIVEQRIGRVQRIGSRFKSVWVANVVHADSAEQRIVARLMEKLQVISHTVGDIEAVLEASDDPNGESFEKQIRQMVIASLQGQDMDQVARKAEQSIAEAKTLFDERQAEMDSKLGSMNDQDSDDLPMPELAKRTPVTPLTQFVHDALTAEGAAIEEETSDVFRASYGERREERFTFDRDVAENMHNSGAFMGRRPILYQPGKPAFERLVQRWLDRGSAWVVDHRVSVTVAREAAASWIAQLDGATMVNCELRGDKDSLSGEIVARARAANAVDSYEKLVQTDFRDVSGATKCVRNRLYENRQNRFLAPFVLCLNPPAVPPTLNEMIRMIAAMGGHVIRSTTKENHPGTQTLWLGLQRVNDLAAAWNTYGPGKSPPNVRS